MLTAACIIYLGLPKPLSAYCISDSLRPLSCLSAYLPNLTASARAPYCSVTGADHDSTLVRSYDRVLIILRLTISINLTIYDSCLVYCTLSLPPSSLFSFLMTLVISTCTPRLHVCISRYLRTAMQAVVIQFVSMPDCRLVSSSSRVGVGLILVNCLCMPPGGYSSCAHWQFGDDDVVSLWSV